MSEFLLLRAAQNNKNLTACERVQGRARTPESEASPVRPQAVAQLDRRDTVIPNRRARAACVAQCVAQTEWRLPTNVSNAASEHKKPSDEFTPPKALDLSPQALCQPLPSEIPDLRQNAEQHHRNGTGTEKGCRMGEEAAAKVDLPSAHDHDNPSDYYTIEPARRSGGGELLAAPAAGLDIGTSPRHRFRNHTTAASSASRNARVQPGVHA